MVTEGGRDTRRVTGDWASELFVAQARPLLRAVVLLLGDIGEAEEVVQEAFARLLSARGRMREPDRAVSYLRSTALNLARGRLRRRGSARRYVAANSRDYLSVGVGWVEEPAADDKALAGRDREEVLRALRQLPVRQRECLVLRYYLGLSEAEIAAAMGVSRGSVKTHASRGLSALESALENHR